MQTNFLGVALHHVNGHLLTVRNAYGGGGGGEGVNAICCASFFAWHCVSLSNTKQLCDWKQKWQGNYSIWFDF